MLTISCLGTENVVIATGYSLLKNRYNPLHAGIAQLVEQLLRKQLVGGSSPLSGTTKANNLAQSVRAQYATYQIVHSKEDQLFF
jgi:hypothetical protein